MLSGFLINRMSLFGVAMCPEKKKITFPDFLAAGGKQARKLSTIRLQQDSLGGGGWGFFPVENANS